MFYLLATTPTHKKGHTLSQNNTINTIQKIQIKSYDFLSNPHFELYITHQEWDKTETVVKFDLYFDTFAILADILQNLGNDIVTAMVNNKVAETKILAKIAEANATE
jgi:hypothetical protein